MGIGGRFAQSESVPEASEKRGLALFQGGKMSLKPNQFAAAYRAGSTVRQVAKAGGCSYNRARRLLKLHLSPGEMRPQGGFQPDTAERIDYSKRQRGLDKIIA